MLNSSFFRLFSGAKKRPIHEETDVQSLENKIDRRRLPMHVAIIMDGNGRWASRQGLPRLSGHAVGSRKAEEIVKIAQDIGIRHITLYVFSTENWKRPRKEVEGLMSLLVELFERRLQDLINYGANIKIIGRRDRLPGPVLAAIINAENKTADNERIFVNLAIDYGGRDEIRRAVQELVMKALMGKIEADAISEEDISLHLYTAGSPDPDLIIRTGGEMRMSNFLTWQSAYSELVVTSRLWPDFSKGDLLLAILEYQRRKRKFGGL